MQSIKKTNINYIIMKKLNKGINIKQYELYENLSNATFGLELLYSTI